MGGHAPPILNFFFKNIIILMSSKFSLKNKSGTPQVFELVHDALKKSNWSNNYKNITLFFTILFFIVKFAFISIKYLIKFGIKHV